MNNFGLIRVAACSPEVKPADVEFNLCQIKALLDHCASLNADIVVFPELCITGYSCADLFHQSLLIDMAMDALIQLADFSKNCRLAFAVGIPVKYQNRLYNCAALIANGKIEGIVPKSFIPNYAEFYEKRWFDSGSNLPKNSVININNDNASLNIPFGTDIIFDINDVKTGIEICEDLWVPIPPSSQLALNGAVLILNLSATNELIGKHKYLIDLIANQSARCRCIYAYASAGTGESSTDLAFAGNCILAANGAIITQSERFSLGDKCVVADIDVENLVHDRLKYETFSQNYNPAEYRIVKVNTLNDYPDLPIGDLLKISKHPFLEKDPSLLAQRCREISSIQAWGLAIRLKAINCSKAVIGISGGLDSTLALLITVKAFDMLGIDRKGIIGISMPGFGTTGRTLGNAEKLMEILGVTSLTIPIHNAVNVHFNDISHDPEVHDVTYENSQARERTQILMDVANKEGAIVIGTGDLSELALGWCTYNGDQMSMYGVNASIPKTLVKYLVEGFANDSNNIELSGLLRDIIETPISPELLPPDPDGYIQQQTEDLVGPYELHDFFLYHALRFGMRPGKILFLAQKAFSDQYDVAVIKHWLKVFYKRFFNQQFKRSVMPDGIKAGNVCLSPRGDWRMPSDASSSLFINDLDSL